jgi:succinate dehydrogenase / fumarate reductase flavoprotein subunit
MAELKFIGGYPEYMRKLIDVVSKTRMKRKDYIPEAMTMAERDEVLQVHPDYATGGKRAIALGLNKGDMAPNEVADLIEAYPLLGGDELDLTKPDFVVDLLIIGGGLAGTSAAVWAHNQGVDK